MHIIGFFSTKGLSCEERRPIDNVNTALSQLLHDVIRRYVIPRMTEMDDRQQCEPVLQAVVATALESQEYVQKKRDKYAECQPGVTVFSQFNTQALTDSLMEKQHIILEDMLFLSKVWDSHVAMRDARFPYLVIIKGHHYIIGDPDAHVDDRGCGGSTHHIHFTDGRRIQDVMTSNLWVQGEIPDQYRELLPDNAIFVAGKD